MISSEKILYWLDLLNQKATVRLLVLVAPGVLAHRAAGSLGLGTGPKMAAAVLMFVGLVVFASWSPIYKRVTGKVDLVENSDDEPVILDEPKLISGMHHVELMDELTSLLGGVDNALKMVHTEIQINPSLSYAAGIETAHRRVMLERKG